MIDPDWKFANDIRLRKGVCEPADVLRLIDLYFASVERGIQEKKKYSETVANVIIDRDALRAGLKDALEIIASYYEDQRCSGERMESPAMIRLTKLLNPAEGGG